MSFIPDRQIVTTAAGTDLTTTVEATVLTVNLPPGKWRLHAWVLFTEALAVTTYRSAHLSASGLTGLENIDEGLGVSAVQRTNTKTLAPEWYEITVATTVTIRATGVFTGVGATMTCQGRLVAEMYQ